MLCIDINTNCTIFTWFKGFTAKISRLGIFFYQKRPSFGVILTLSLPIKKYQKNLKNQLTEFLK